MQYIPVPHTRMPTQPLLFRYQPNSMIFELLFPSSIFAVKLNRKLLVMRLLHVIETSPNTEGVLFLSIQFPRTIAQYVGAAICALSPSADNSYSAYPSSVPSPTSPMTDAGGTGSSFTASSTSALSSSTSQAPHSGNVLLFSTRSLNSTSSAPTRLPRAQFHWHAPRHFLRKGDGGLGMECLRCREAVLVPSGYEGGEDLVDEF